jgi:type VI secretion system secreted protein Hcp
MATHDYFLKMDGIDGESTDKKHSKEVEVVRFKFRAFQAGTAGSATGGLGKGKVKLDDFHIWKKTDKSSPKLFQACCAGTGVKSITFTAREAGGDQQDYYKVTMSNCIVSSFETSYGEEGHAAAPGADDWIQIEKVTFNFSSIEVSYKEQKADGTLGGEIKGQWNATTNTPTT